MALIGGAVMNRQIERENIKRKRFRAAAWIAVVALLLVGAGVGWMEAPSASPQQTKSQSRVLADQLSDLFASAADEVGPSVVPIFAEQKVETGNFVGPNDDLRRFFGDDFFRRFFGTPQGAERTVRSMGSGVIVSSDGYILTNNHVVSGANKLTVVMEDGKKYSANVVGTDPHTDVAVIKIDAKNLPAAKLGDSDDVKVGQWVIAVGNPFQLLHSVTAGIISAKGRSSIGLTDYEDFMQTDASINPGNSGGALADLDGNVIGINTAISSPSGASAGVGFAIPIKMASHIMDELIKNGKVERGFLALLPQDVNDNLAKAMNLKSTEGALVGDVTPGGPADKAGLERGDVIIEFQGKKVKNSTDLRNQVAATPPDTTVTVGVLRDGKEIDMHVKLDERPDTNPKTNNGRRAEEPKMNEKLGLQVQELTPDIAQQLGYKNAHGVVVSNVSPGTAAGDAGLARGDLIEEVNHSVVDSISDLNHQLSKMNSGDTALLLVRRGQNTFFAAIKMP
jgi:serine protease Do